MVNSVECNNVGYKIVFTPKALDREFVEEKKIKLPVMILILTHLVVVTLLIKMD